MPADPRSSPGTGSPGARTFGRRRPAGARALRLLAVGIVAVAPLQFGVLARPASAAPPTALAVTTVGGYLAVVLPAGYDSGQLAASAAERRRMTGAAVAALAASPVVRAERAPTDERAGHVDNVVLFVDAAGNVVRPDIEAARQEGSAATGDLTFTFESPAHPFTAAQIASMRTWIGDFYPLVKAMFGPPSNAITVNISYDPTVSGEFGGFFFPGSNEIVLGDPSAVDVLVHEMIHAFHDDFMLASQWEETMTRAAEVAAFNQLSTYAHWDAHHSSYHDVWVDPIDAQAALGSPSMSMWDGFPNLWMRYNIGGYEWWKVLHARPAFFSTFNRALYGRPDDTMQEAALVEMAAAAAPTVEGLPFSLWYISHGVFNSAPPNGYQFVISPASPDAWLFNRFEGGGISPLGGVPVAWQTQAVDGRVLASGSTTTWASGAVQLDKDPVPGSYAGRVLLTYTATVGTQTVTGSTWLSSTSGGGVFGVAPGLSTGSVTIANLEDPAAPPVTVPLVKGAFDAPSLSPTVGRFRATLTRTDGTIAARRVFTKDASPYALILETRPTPSVNLKTAAIAGPATVTQGTDAYVAVTVRNLGPSTAPPSSSRVVLSKDATPDPGDIPMPALARLRAIAPGAQLESWTVLQVPTAAPAGTYRLLSCADDNGLIPETSETDNCKAGPTITVVPPAPDLTVLSVRTPPAQARRGTTFTAGDRTANLGQLPAAASLNRYLLSHDKQRDGGDVPMTPRRHVPALAPAADSSGTVVVTIPASTSTGLYWVLACADDTHVVAESNETDNCRASPAQIKVVA
jgi:CARDB